MTLISSVASSSAPERSALWPVTPVRFDPFAVARQLLVERPFSVQSARRFWSRCCWQMSPEYPLPVLLPVFLPAPRSRTPDYSLPQRRESPQPRRKWPCCPRLRRVVRRASRRQTRQAVPSGVQHSSVHVTLLHVGVIVETPLGWGLDRGFRLAPHEEFPRNRQTLVRLDHWFAEIGSAKIGSLEIGSDSNNCSRTSAAEGNSSAGIGPSTTSGAGAKVLRP